MKGDNAAYYGILVEIIEWIYLEGWGFILFKCDWVDPIREIIQGEYGYTLVNLKSHWRTNEPYVLAFQAIQVFYTPESKGKNWHAVIVTKPRDLFEMEDDVMP